jgi:signal transduction histidine kinase
VAEATDLLRPQAADAGLALTVDIPEEAVLAGADPRALSRVVINLVSNAVKYTEKGSVTVSAAALREGGAEIRVADTGTGIAPDFLPHLFEEFRQESEGDGRRYEGVGLGLAIVRRLVDAMGGEISIESEKGAGSTFTVRLGPPVASERLPRAVRAVA